MKITLTKFKNEQIALFLIVVMVLVGVIFYFPKLNFSASSGGLITYYADADTQLSTGTINLGTNKNISYTDLKIPENAQTTVLGSSFVNSSGTIRVEISLNPKYCSYTLNKRTGTGEGIFWQTYDVYGPSRNDFTYDVKVTTPRDVIGPITLSPFTQSLYTIPVSSSLIGKSAYVRIKGQDATLGQTNCLDTGLFKVLSWGDKTIVVRTSTYDTLISKLQVNWFNPIPDAGALISAYDMFNNEQSTYRYTDEEFEGLNAIYNLQQPTIRYKDDNLGNPQIQVEAPLWAFNTLVYQKPPEGVASSAKCEVPDTQPGKQTYLKVSFTNTGDSSKFFYTIKSSQFSVSGTDNSGRNVANGETFVKLISATVPNQIGTATAAIDISGESGRTTQITCSGQIKSDVTPPPPPGECPSEIAVEYGGECLCKNTGLAYDKINGCPIQNVTGAICIPVIQRVKTDTIKDESLSAMIFGASFQPKIFQSCEWDYTTIGMILFLIASGFYLVGSKNKDEEQKKIGMAIGGVALLLIIISIIYSNALMIAFGGFGIVLIVGAILVVKFVLL